jgi:hypothetical protein
LLKFAAEIYRFCSNIRLFCENNLEFLIYAEYLHDKKVTTFGNSSVMPRGPQHQVVLRASSELNPPLYSIHDETPLEDACTLENEREYVHDN